MGKKKSKDKQKKKNQNGVEVWTEEQHEEYLAGLYGFEFIAGYTANGFPYGIMADEEEYCGSSEKSKSCPHKIQRVIDDEDLPF